MASTYTIGKALAILQTQVKAPDLTPIAALIADEAVSWIWDAFDWRATLKELPPFFIIPREQDYGAPLSAIPSDFYQLRAAWIRDTESQVIYPLTVVARMPVEMRYATPESIAHEPDIGKFRLHPVPPASWAASRFQVEGRYKKRHTKISPDNLNSEKIPWDDQHFSTFRSVLKWKYLEEIGAPGAGQMVVYPDGSVTATGAAASALNSLLTMARREGLGDPPETRVPDVDLFM